MVFNITVSQHPDGEQDIRVYGNANVYTPLLQSFLALHYIPCRQVSYHLYLSSAPDWKVLTPQLRALLEYMATSVRQTLEFSIEHTTATIYYDHAMHFQFAQDAEWFYIITPATVDQDLYGSDHGMYAHDIIKVPDLFQTELIERLLTKWQIPFETIKGQPMEGFKIALTDHPADVAVKLRTELVQLIKPGSATFAEIKL